MGRACLSGEFGKTEGTLQRLEAMEEFQDGDKGSLSKARRHSLSRLRPGAPGRAAGAAAEGSCAEGSSEAAFQAALERGAS